MAGIVMGKSCYISSAILNVPPKGHQRAGEDFSAPVHFSMALSERSLLVLSSPKCIGLADARGGSDSFDSLRDYIHVSRILHPRWMICLPRVCDTDHRVERWVIQGCCNFSSSLSVSGELGLPVNSLLRVGRDFYNFLFYFFTMRLRMMRVLRMIRMINCSVMSIW